MDIATDDRQSAKSVDAAWSLAKHEIQARQICKVFVAEPLWICEEAVDTASWKIRRKNGLDEEVDIELRLARQPSPLLRDENSGSHQEAVHAIARLTMATAFETHLTIGPYQRVGEYVNVRSKAATIPGDDVCPQSSSWRRCRDASHA
jgi:hypothetical protein